MTNAIRLNKKYNFISIGKVQSDPLTASGYGRSTKRSLMPACNPKIKVEFKRKYNTGPLESIVKRVSMVDDVHTGNKRKAVAKLTSIKGGIILPILNTIKCRKPRFMLD